MKENSKWKVLNYHFQSKPYKSLKRFQAAVAACYFTQTLTEWFVNGLLRSLVATLLTCGMMNDDHSVCWPHCIKIMWLCDSTVPTNATWHFTIQRKKKRHVNKIQKHSCPSGPELIQDYLKWSRKPSFDVTNHRLKFIGSHSCILGLRGLLACYQSKLQKISLMIWGVLLWTWF